MTPTIMVQDVTLHNAANVSEHVNRTCLAGT